MSGDETPKSDPLREEQIQSSESASEIPEIEKEINAAAGKVTESSPGKQIEGGDGGGDGEDGFRTPTSSENKIPPVTDCPPAPRKSKNQSSKLKRKASSSSPPPAPPQARRRILESDASTEVESIFRPDSGQDDSVEDQRPVAKKAKTDGED
ncbi:uncharacterized protein LOC127251006 [Andrographis paniculata]|uniref:uncharacterized protein LOC127251006 n=1 Tax=Andrographis paniculata TaxID=175694 RepID=UPI0021E84E07|nr:uncharacterized protein LOC127251006 [Andrographis paniculata]